MTTPELVGWLEAHPNKGVKILTFVTKTTPKNMTVKSRSDKDLKNPYLAGEFYHLASRTIPLGSSYEAAVNKQRLAEGNEPSFVAEALWHGAGRRHGTYTVYHVGTGKVYFAYKPLQRVIDGTVIAKNNTLDEWWHNGRKLSDAEVAYLKVNYLKKNGSNADHQGVDEEDETLWRTLGLDGVVSMKYEGELYTIDQSIEATIENLPIAA